MLIFLSGLDTYRSREKLREMVAEYTNKHQGGLNIDRWDCLEVSFEALEGTLRSHTLFQEKRLTILEHVLKNAELGRLLFEYRQKLLETPQSIIIFFEEGEVDVKHPLAQYLSRTALCQEFFLLEGKKLLAWVNKEFQRRKLAIAPGVAEKLASEVGSDLWQLSREIEKLAAFKQGTGVIEKADVEALVRPHIETEVFRTVDAIAAQERKLALELLALHFQCSEPPLRLLSLLLFQFRALLLIKDMAARGMPRALISKHAKMHPYAFHKSYGLAQRLSSSELKRIYEQLFLLDLQIKTGKVNPEMALYLFVASYPPVQAAKE